MMMVKLLSPTNDLMNLRSIKKVLMFQVCITATMTWNDPDPLLSESFAIAGNGKTL